MDEATKQKLLISAIPMAITVTIFQLFFNRTEGDSLGTFMMKMVLGVVIGLVIGGAVFGVMKMMDK